MRKLIVSILLSLLIPMCYAGSGGYSNDISDLIAVSQGSAVTARAFNASTNWYNPAGLSFIEGQDIAVTASYERAQYALDSDTGKNIDAEPGNFCIPSLFYSCNMGDWALGLGLNTPYGLTTEWDNSVTNYVATKTELEMINFNPNIAYKFSNTLSLAFGVDYQTCSGEMGRMINQTYLNTMIYRMMTNGNGVMISPDAKSTMEGDDTALGWNTALMYKINETTQLGLSYRNKTKFNLDGKTKISGLSGYAAAILGGSSYKTDAELGIYIPSTLDFGISKKITDKTTLEFDIEWAEWSAVEEMKIKYSESDPVRSSILNSENPLEKDWKDTWNYGLGIEHHLNDEYTVYGGTRYRPSPVPNKTMDPSLPGIDLFEISMGLGKNYFGGHLQFSADYIWGDADANNTIGNKNGTSVNGNYTLEVFIAGLTYSCKL